MKRTKQQAPPLLSELISRVDKLFPKSKKAYTYDYCLGRFPNGLWCFRLVNNWYKWVNKGYEINFYGEDPYIAIIEFLRYVNQNKINVRKLAVHSK